MIYTTASCSSMLRRKISVSHRLPPLAGLRAPTSVVPTAAPRPSVYCRAPAFAARYENVPVASRFVPSRCVPRAVDLRPSPAPPLPMSRSTRASVKPHFDEGKRAIPHVSWSFDYH